MDTRIRRNIIILVVVTFLVLIGMSAGWFFVLVRPQREQIATVQGEYETRKGIADKLPAALKKQRLAEDKLSYLTGQLFFFRGSEENRLASGLYRRLYFGAIDGTDPINVRDRQEAWRAWMNEYHFAYGPELERTLRDAAADAPAGLATVGLTMPAIKVDDPPQKPEDVKAPANGFLKPLSATNNGSLELSVSGSFQNILRFLERINRSPILMVVGNIKLDGYAPNLKATFSVTPYLVAAGKGAKLSATSAAPAGDAAAPGAGPPAAGGGDAVGDAEKKGDGDADGGGKKKKDEATVKIKNPRTAGQRSASQRSPGNAEAR